MNCTIVGNVLARVAAVADTSLRLVIIIVIITVECAYVVVCCHSVCSVSASHCRAIADDQGTQSVAIGDRGDRSGLGRA